LDRFNHAKAYHKFDNNIPHIERDIGILDESMESPSKALSPPHEVLTIYLDQGDPLSDVIESHKSKT